jgi:hypothetical protein
VRSLVVDLAEFTHLKPPRLILAAAYTLRETERSMGVPPHWNLYVTVILDLTGASICIREPKEHIGAGTISEPGSLCRADRMSPDPEAAAKRAGRHHLRRPMSVGTAGSMTVLSDPQGAFLALFEVGRAG